MTGLVNRLLKIVFSFYIELPLGCCCTQGWIQDLGLVGRASRAPKTEEYRPRDIWKWGIGRGVFQEEVSGGGTQVCLPSPTFQTTDWLNQRRWNSCRSGH